MILLNFNKKYFSIFFLFWLITTHIITIPYYCTFYAWDCTFHILGKYFLCGIWRNIGLCSRASTTQWFNVCYPRKFCRLIIHGDMNLQILEYFNLNTCRFSCFIMLHKIWFTSIILQKLLKIPPTTLQWSGYSNFC